MLKSQESVLKSLLHLLDSLVKFHTDIKNYKGYKAYFQVQYMKKTLSSDYPEEMTPSGFHVGCQMHVYSGTACAYKTYREKRTIGVSVR